MSAQGKRRTICDASIVAFSFNKDRTEAVFSPNNHLLYVVACKDPHDCTTWEVTATLEQHDQTVSATDWHAHSNRILSASHDRTAFVWQRHTHGEWKPQMVMLDAGVKRGLTVCAWNYSGTKVYVGSAASNIAVGRFDAENEWWMCRLLTSDTGTLTALAAHTHSDALLATGGTEGTVRLVSTFMKKIDAEKTASFGYVYVEKALGACVHAIAWAPCGKRLAVATHDSCVYVLNFPSLESLSEEGQDTHTLHRISLSILPLKSLVFLSDEFIIGGGFDYMPVLLTHTHENDWKLSGKWTAVQTREVKTSQQIAREKFQNEARMGQTHMDEDLVQTRHTNTINGVFSLLTGGYDTFSVQMKGAVFATASLDGRVETWTMEEMVPIT